MSFDLNGVDAPRALGLEAQRASRTAAGSGGPFADALAGREAARVDAIPAAPPPEVLDEVFAAQRAIQDMYSRRRQLHFELEGGRVRIQLQDLEGNVLKEISPSRALEIAGGWAVHR